MDISEKRCPSDGLELAKSQAISRTGNCLGDDENARKIDTQTQLDLTALEATTGRSLDSERQADARKSNPGVLIFTSEGRPRKQVDILVDIGQQHLLFHDRSGMAYAQIEIDGHCEVYSIESTAYREVLAERYLYATDRGCNRNSTGDAIATLTSVAKFRGPVADVWLRVAYLDSSKEEIVIDMGRRDWRCIVVTAEGWNWCASPPNFRRAGAPLALPEPAEPNFSLLWKYANVRIEDRPLLAAFLLATLRPTGPYPQLHLTGEQGTGKSTLARVIRALTDPSSSPLRAPPKEVRDLLVGALNGWVLSLDNLSYVTPSLSDALCRLSTGGAISERALYTNTDEVLVEVQRPVIINGIEDLAHRPDLAERALHVELALIQNRQPESIFWRDFYLDAPAIFAGLLDGMSQALRDHASVRIERLPRMADFAIWSAAGMPALGFTSEAFLHSYRTNQSDGMAQGVDSSPVGVALLAMMQTRPSGWTGSAGDLLSFLGTKVSESVTRAQRWPRTPRALAGALKRLAPALRVHGIDVGSTERTAHARGVTLQWLPERPSQPSSLAPGPVRTDDCDQRDDRSVSWHIQCPSCGGEGCNWCSSSSPP